MTTLVRAKKDAYFTPGNLEAVSGEMVRQLEYWRERHRSQLFEASQAVLLVLDMQRYFLEPTSHAYIPSAPAILPGINGLVEAFISLKRPIFLTRHVNTPADAGQMGDWWKDLIQEDSPMSQVVDMMAKWGLPVVQKSQYDAFYGTSLEDFLRQAGAQQVLICGVMTHLCCETTARSAFMRGFKVFVLVDGMATYNREFHEATLLNLAHGFAYPLQLSEISALLAKEGTWPQ